MFNYSGDQEEEDKSETFWNLRNESLTNCFTLWVKDELLNGNDTQKYSEKIPSGLSWKDRFYWPQKTCTLRPTHATKIDVILNVMQLNV